MSDARRGTGAGSPQEAAARERATKGASAMGMRSHQGTVVAPPQPAGRPPPSAHTRDGATTSPRELTAGERLSQRRDAIYRRSLALADVLATLLALGFDELLFRSGTFSWGLLLAVPLVVMVGKAAGLYDRDENLLAKGTLDEVPGLLIPAGFYAIAAWVIGELVINDPLERGQAVELCGLVFGTLILFRAITRRTVRAVTPPERCLVLGSEVDAMRLERAAETAGGVKSTVIGRVPWSTERDPEPPVVGVPVLGAARDLLAILADHGVERVVVGPSADPEEALDAVRLVSSLDHKVSVLPRLFEVVGSSAAYDKIGGVTLLGVRRFGLTRSSKSLKRGMDIIGSGAGLVLLSPLLAAIAIAVKVSSPGPALFRQPRIGREGERFDMLKFRTMVEGADERKDELAHLNEADGLFKITDDPRLTSVGRILRGAYLDELPQLVNVLRGQMSLVGPRPLIPNEDSQVTGWDRLRLHMAPGMTGLWQIAGASRVPLREMVKMDYLYVANWSLWGDIKILLRTVPYVLARPGR